MSEAKVADIGSGAGLPGIVVALARPELKVSLIEPLQRRVEFLYEAIEALKLDNVEVIRAKAAPVAAKLRAGMVAINNWGPTPGAPFGGYKQSGNGREGGLAGLKDFMEMKAISGLPA